MTNVINIFPSRAQVGEGPVWHKETGSVYWVDIVAGEVHQTSLDSKVTKTFTIAESVGAVAPRETGGLVAAVASGFMGFDAEGGETHHRKILAPGLRMNDAKTDPRGVYWSGSCELDFEPGRGGLWRMDKDWEPSLVLEGLTLPNGLGWSPDGHTFYLVDSLERVVRKYGYDPGSSQMDTQSEVLMGPEMFPGLPDGLAVDTRGHLWIAEFSASALHEFSPEGILLQTISMPTSQPTSCAFVGDGLDQLWVTSAALGVDPAKDPDAGAIFEVQGHGAVGMPVAKFRG